MRALVRDREHGGVLPLLLGMLLVLAAAFFGATTIGRVVVAKGEAQRAADAACLTMANIVKYEGLQVVSEQQTRAEALARLNSKLPLTFVWTRPPETATAVDFQCKATAAVPAPMFIWNAGTLSVSATASGRAEQQTITQAEKKYPQFVIVMDFSGSMMAAMGGGQPSSAQNDSFHVLLRAVKRLLDEDYDFKYGMVAFASTATKITSKVQLGNGTAMTAQVNGAMQCPKQGCGCPYNGQCLTNSAGGLKAARELLSDGSLPPEEAKYVLFISDGAPTVPGSGSAGENPARAEATQLWNRNVTIHTLHLINVPSSAGSVIANLKRFMVSISGPPENRGVEAGYYHDANDNTGLEDFIVGLGAALACQIGPLDPAPPNPSKMHVFVRQGQQDLPLINARTVTNVDPGRDGSVPANDVGDLWDRNEPFKNGNYFFYETAKKMVYVTPGVCAAVQDNDQDIIVRFASPQLTK